MRFEGVRGLPTYIYTPTYIAEGKQRGERSAKTAVNEARKPRERVCSPLYGFPFRRHYPASPSPPSPAAALRLVFPYRSPLTLSKFLPSILEAGISKPPYFVFGNPPDPPRYRCTLFEADGFLFHESITAKKRGWGGEIIFETR